MSTDPDQIREDIERTRAELSSDVDALTDKVSPTQVAHRQADKVRSAVGGVKDKVKDTVMGTVNETTSTAGSTASAVGSAAKDLPHTAAAQARGNPLAAGLVAFGAGWLIASLLPATRKEQDLAQTAKQQAAPLVQEAKDSAKQVADHLREPAQDAAAAVKDRATQAGTTLRDQTQHTTQDLREQTTSTTQNGY